MDVSKPNVRKGSKRGFSFQFRKAKDAASIEKLVAKREALRKKFLGSNEKSGILNNIVIYTLLIAIGFIFLYPLMYMLATSFMNRDDLLDSSIRWIPTTLYTKNYSDAIAVMDYLMTLLKNVYIAIVPTIIQVAVCSCVGYGFARYNFPLKKLWMGILILTFVLPPQIMMIPNYVLFNSLGLIGSIRAFIIPALLGQGFKSSIFILIFYNFHKQTPHSLIEAAEIDGAGHLYSFLKIAVPLSVPAIVTVFLFSFVWYWNETYLVNLYLGFGNSRANGGLTTLLLELQRFQSSYDTLYSSWEASPNRLNEAIRMAGTMITVAPLIVVYFIMQKQFVQSIDNAGITGE